MAASDRAPSSRRRWAALGEQIWSMLDGRFQLRDLVEFARHKVVPVGQHSTVWYYLGGVTVFFFTIQIVTGILLLMYYQPGETTSHESMKYVVTKVRWGWLVRSTHCWSAHLMTLSLVVHMFSVFFTKAYRYPRELTWYTGFLLYGLVLTFGFSGYLLPWNELSFFATAVGTDSVKAVPVIGHWLLRVMRGGDEVTINTLYRFFALHVCILPISAFGLIGFHLLLIQRQGMADVIEPVGGRRHGPRLGMRFVPNFIARDFLFWILCLNVLGVLAVCLPYGLGIPGLHWDLGAKADPLKPAYPGIKPEWYFLWIYQLLREFPAVLLGLEGPQVCLLVVNILMGIWLLIPVLDRNARHGRPSPAFTDFGVAGVYFLSFLTLKAWDLGVHVPHGVDAAADPGNLEAIGRVCAAWTLGLALGVTALRWSVLRSRFLGFSLLAVAHVVMHAYFGIGYVAAGAAVALAGLALAAVLAVPIWRQARVAAAARLLVITAAFVGTWPGSGGQQALAQEPASVPTVEPYHGSDGIRALLAATDAQGAAVLGEEERRRFQQLPPHVVRLFDAALDKSLITSAVQIRTLMAAGLNDEKLQLYLQDNCVLCHLNPEFQGDRTRIRHSGAGSEAQHSLLELKTILADVHMQAGLSCAGCHGGTPADEEMSEEIAKRWPAAAARAQDRTWVPGFCARCHSDPAVMRRHNPSLPVDQLLKYGDSRHGQLLLQKKDSKAAQCVSCHGAHGITRVGSPASPVYPKNQPDTCGKCHADPEYMAGYVADDGTPLPTTQVADYRRSTHGTALFEKGDLGVAVCNDCHGNHAAMPPSVSSVASVCRTCHVSVGELYDGSPHAAAFRKNGWPECETCHGRHHIEKLTFDAIVPRQGGLCVDCHEKTGRPEPLSAAAFFHERIRKLQADRQQVGLAIAGLQSTFHSLDLDELNFRRDRLDDQIKDLRLQVHAFSRDLFDKMAIRASATASGILQTCDAVRADFRLRRLWLLASTAIITTVAVLLYLKVRALDRQYPLVILEEDQTDKGSPDRKLGE